MSLYRDQNRVYVFLCMVLLAVKMVADVTETRNVIPCVRQWLNLVLIFIVLKKQAHQSH